MNTSKAVAGTVGSGIKAMRSAWTFSGNVPNTFSEHMRTSVPFYDTGHQLICELSDFFVQEKSACYELGTSVGTLIKKLAERHNHKPNVNWYGIDNVPEMIELAKKETSSDNNRITYLVDDVLTTEFEKSDLIVAYYTLQFVPLAVRQQTIDRIYQALNWGGAFICFEKVRACDARFQDYMTQVYTEYKTSQGYTPEEILNKAASLKSVLEPFSTQGNIDLFRRAGFVDIMTVYKWVCFEGFLCIK